MAKRIDHDLWQEPEDLEVVITHDHPVDLDQSTTIIRATEDGITIEFYLNGEITGAITSTYEEWFQLSQHGVMPSEESV